METAFPSSQALQPVEQPKLGVPSAGESNISNDLTIIGDVSTSGAVTLDGAIEGNIYCTSLTVTENGRVNGGIVANQEVTVQGTVTGTIRGRRVVLQSSAKVQGDILHQGIGIEMGTRYDGTLRWTEDEQAFDEPASHRENEPTHETHYNGHDNGHGDHDHEASAHDDDDKRRHLHDEASTRSLQEELARSLYEEDTVGHSGV